MSINVLTSSGIVRAEDARVRCVSKSCRVLYGNNFLKRKDGVRKNTARSRDRLGEVLIATSHTGVCAKYIALRYARTFRASANPSSECSSLAQMLRGDPEGAGVPFGERRMREALRTALMYWVRLLDIESGVEGSDAEEHIALCRGFPVSAH